MKLEDKLQIVTINDELQKILIPHDIIKLCLEYLNRIAPDSLREKLEKLIYKYPENSKYPSTLEPISLLMNEGNSINITDLQWRNLNISSTIFFISLRGWQLSCLHLFKSSWENVTIDHCDLTSAYFQEITLKNINFFNCKLDGMQFIKCKFSDVKIFVYKNQPVNLLDLTGSTLDQFSLNIEEIKALNYEENKEDKSLIEDYYYFHQPHPYPDLYKPRLNFYGINFTNVIFNDVDKSGWATEARFIGANLTGAVFNCSIKGSYFSYLHLRQADFRNASHSEEAIFRKDQPYTKWLEAAGESPIDEIRKSIIQIFLEKKESLSKNDIKIVFGLLGSLLPNRDDYKVDMNELKHFMEHKNLPGQTGFFSPLLHQSLSEQYSQLATSLTPGS